MAESITFTRYAAALAAVALLAACGTTPRAPGPGQKGSDQTGARSGKYYQDDGPGASPPADLDRIPDATPRPEALHRFANRPYSVLGRNYVPATTLRPYREQGVASWYGRKFHGQKTAIGETYDMYAMTAAHPTLPLPSYARVTRVATGKSVVVRVNDRGPFLHGRVIDLSYAAAHRIGIATQGSGEVVVEAIIPGERPVLAAAAPLPPVAAAQPATAPAIVLPETPPSTSPQAGRDNGAGGGFAVQLGAFQNYANAQNFLAHVQEQLASLQVEPRVRESSGWYRVYLGPYADRAEARRMAEHITQAFGLDAAIAAH